MVQYHGSLQQQLYITAKIATFNQKYWTGSARLVELAVDMRPCQWLLAPLPRYVENSGTTEIRSKQAENGRHVDVVEVAGQMTTSIKLKLIVTESLRTFPGNISSFWKKKESKYRRSFIRSCRQGIYNTLTAAKITCQNLSIFNFHSIYSWHDYEV